MDKERFIDWILRAYQKKFTDKTFITGMLRNIIDYANRTFPTKEGVARFIFGKQKKKPEKSKNISETDI